jgi:hypothetical protein
MHSRSLCEAPLRKTRLQLGRLLINRDGAIKAFTEVALGGPSSPRRWDRSLR